MSHARMRSASPVAMRWARSCSGRAAIRTWDVTAPFFWLIPVMILAVVYGALAVFTKGSVLAPFIYTLF